MSLIYSEATAAGSDHVRAAQAAFQCAEFARFAPGIEMTEQRVRLIAFGMAEARAAGPAAIGAGTVPPEWVGSVSDDFWTGYYLAQTSDYVDQDLQTAAAQIGGTFAKQFEWEQSSAAQQFQDGNCDLLGR